jgi:hypothetical protein
MQKSGSLVEKSDIFSARKIEADGKEKAGDIDEEK